MGESRSPSWNATRPARRRRVALPRATSRAARETSTACTSASGRAAVSGAAASSRSAETVRLEVGPGGLARSLARLRRARLRVLELLGLRMGDEGVHDLVEVSVEHVLEAMEAEADAVVGDPRLLEVVRADLLAAVAGAHLALALARDLALLLLQRHLVQARAQDLHGLLAVLDLALLVLAGHHGVRGQMGDANRGVRRVQDRK